MKTALWAAALRARTNPFVSDPFAMALLGEEGFQQGAAYEEAHGAGDEILKRTRLFDDMILRAISEHGIDTVIYPGSGLDTRPYRLALPPELAWYEIDFPNVLNWKAAALSSGTPACHIERLPADLSSPHAVQTALGDRAKAGNCLFVMENLLHYLDGLQAQNLFRDIHGIGEKNIVLADIGSPALPESALGNAMFAELEKAKSQRVGIADIQSFAAHAGYRVLSSVPFMALRGAPERWIQEKAPWWMSKAKQDLLRVVLLERI